jgi:hypothetical protein
MICLASMPQVVLVPNVIKIVRIICYRDMNMRHDRLAVEQKHTN